MADLALMAQAVDFIEANLSKDVRVADMAEAVVYSLYHFCRVFNQVTRYTPYDYLMRRRLSAAALALLQSKRKIIDIGLDYQFNNAEVFSRAFKRVFGVQPSQLRKQGQVERHLLTPRLTLAHLEQWNKGDYLRPVLLEKEAFLLAGVMGVVGEPLAEAGLTTDDRAIRGLTEIAELWQMLANERCKRQDGAAWGNYYGVCMYPAGGERGWGAYLAGAQVGGDAAAAVQAVGDTILVVKMIPAQKWVRFIHKGPRRELELTLDYIYHAWAAQRGVKVAYSMLVEGYGRGEGAGGPGGGGADAEIEVLVPIMLDFPG